jgi:hypothetical protein
MSGGGVSALETATTGDVIEYFKNASALAERDAYPSSPSASSKCLLTLSMEGAQIMGQYGYERINAKDEDQLKRAVRQRGPVSVMFQVTNDFLLYSDGIYQAGSTCAPGADTVNHALLVIGFGSDAVSGQDYWLVQNSWGSSWGQNGFAKIRRGSNTCGIASCPAYPSDIVDPSHEARRNF